RPERALPLFRKALDIDQKRLGPDHPHTASLLSQEGLAYIHTGKFGLAEHDLVRATEILSRCQGGFYEVALAKNDLGLLRFKQKKLEKAAELLNEALKLEEGPGNAAAGDLANTLRLLADVRDQEHRTAEAAQLRSRAVAVQSLR